MVEASENDFDNFFSICGLLGGIIFPLSMVPQLWKTFRTKSAEDLSYFCPLGYSARQSISSHVTSRQVLFLMGILMVGTYGVAYELWPIVYPLVADLTFMVALLIMKIYFDKYRPTSSKLVAEVDERSKVEGDLDGHERPKSDESKSNSVESVPREQGGVSLGVKSGQGTHGIEIGSASSGV